MDMDQIIERISRDADHLLRMSMGQTPWPAAHEQDIIDRFGIFQEEQDLGL